MSAPLTINKRKNIRIKYFHKEPTFIHVSHYVWSTWVESKRPLPLRTKTLAQYVRAPAKDKCQTDVWTIGCKTNIFKSEDNNTSLFIKFICNVWVRERAYREACPERWSIKVSSSLYSPHQSNAVAKTPLYFRGKKRKHKKDKKEKSEKRRVVVDEDAQKHGGWWKCTKIEEITGSIAIQYGKRTYVKSLDNGLFTLGAPHDEGDGPAPEEIFTAIQINEKHVAFKSGYGKYLKVEKDGVITGRSDAVGGMEQFEPVFQVCIVFTNNYHARVFGIK